MILITIDRLAAISVGYYRSHYISHYYFYHRVYYIVTNTKYSVNLKT